jgi:WD40 repeat protein
MESFPMSFQRWIVVLCLLSLAASVQSQPEPVRLAHDKTVYAVAFAPDGRTLLSASDDGFVRLWDVASRREIQRWQAHHGRVLAMTLTDGGKTIATGGKDGLVRYWDRATLRETRQFTGGPGDIEGLSVSSDGKVLAVSSSGGTGTFRTETEGLVFT